MRRRGNSTTRASDAGRGEIVNEECNEARRPVMNARNALYIGLFLLFVIAMAAATFTPNLPPH